jgi:hypothetical protein
MSVSLRPLCLLLICLCPAVLSAQVATERLEYDVVYRGVFSMGADMPIADVVLASRRADGNGLGEARLEASSAAYPVVEALYPLRYRFRTWLADGGELVAFETYEKTARLRHRLYLRDDSRLGVKRLDLTKPGAGAQAMARLDAGRVPVEAGGAAGALSDRLGLLQRVRAEPLHAGAEYRFAVTNGSKRIDYRVRVEKAEVLRIGEVALAAWKVRFDASKTRRNGEVEEVHQPLYLWLSQAAGHIPLRADSRHPIGLFRVQLKDPRRLQQLAGLPG